MKWVVKFGRKMAKFTSSLKIIFFFSLLKIFSKIIWRNSLKMFVRAIRLMHFVFADIFLFVCAVQLTPECSLTAYATCFVHKYVKKHNFRFKIDF